MRRTFPGSRRPKCAFEPILRLAELTRTIPDQLGMRASPEQSTKLPASSRASNAHGADRVEEGIAEAPARPFDSAAPFFRDAVTVRARSNEAAEISASRQNGDSITKTPV